MKISRNMEGTVVSSNQQTLLGLKVSTVSLRPLNVYMSMPIIGNNVINVTFIHVQNNKLKNLLA